MREQQFEVRRHGPKFTQVPNALIWDENLRPQTKFLLIAMLSFSSSWDFSIRGLAAKTGMTKDTISRMISELIDAGYVRRKEQARSKAGSFAKAGYIVTDTANKFDIDEEDAPRPKNQDAEAEQKTEPCPDLSYTAEPYTINSPQIYTKQVYTKQDNNTPYSPPEGDKPAEKRSRRRKVKSVPDWNPVRFEQFWNYYGLKVDRVRAVAEWDALKPDDALIDHMARTLKRQKQSELWRRGIGIPHPARWLRNRRWEDEDVGPREQPLETDGDWAPDPEVIT